MNTVLVIITLCAAGTLDSRHVLALWNQSFPQHSGGLPEGRVQ